MPIPVLVQLPSLYIYAWASIGFVAATIRVATLGTHWVLAALRDVREYRRGN